jgi:cytochrome c peroxidase
MTMKAGCSALGLCVIGAMAGSGCTDTRAFTDEQRAVLAQFRLPAGPPPDPSNAFADDVRAAVLGKKWFFDPRLSGPIGPGNDGVTNGSLGVTGDRGKVACVSCHDPAMGGSDHRSRPPQTSLGAGYSGRNAQTVLNAAWVDLDQGGWQTWDGSGDSVWGGNLLPLEKTTSNNATRLQLAHIVFDHYKADYEALFGPLPDLSNTIRFPLDGKPGDHSGFDNLAPADKDAINRVFANMGKAIAAYERRLVSTAFQPSAFDRMLAGDDAAMTAAAIRGARLYIGKAACDECHRGPLFADQKFHNIGVPQTGEHAFETDLGRDLGIMNVQQSLFTRAGAFSDALDDSHLRSLARRPADLGAFKTPTLRNVARTGPYMHDGVYATLGEVIDHYNRGGGMGDFSGTKEVTIAPLLLDDQEMSDLVEFLSSLDDGPPLPTPDFPEGLIGPPTLPN